MVVTNIKKDCALYMLLCESGLCSTKGAIATLFNAKLQLSVSGVNICCLVLFVCGSQC